METIIVSLVGKERRLSGDHERVKRGTIPLMSKDMNFHVHFMKREIEEYRKTPVRYDCDVVVCGGGTAGFTAALAAARNGADTILVERFGHVGGTLVNGAGPLHSFFNLYKAYADAAKTQVVQGIPQEIVTRMMEASGSPGHLEQDKGGNYDSAITLIDWEIFKDVAFTMLEEAGVRILLHTVIADVIKDGGRLEGIIIEGKSGREAILARTVIDSTGDGDVAALAGAEFVKKHDTTSVGMPFGMTNVDMPRLVEFCREKGLVNQLIEGDKGSVTDHVIRLGFELKKVPEFTEFMERTGMWGPLGFSLHEGEFTYINSAALPSVDTTDTEAYSKAEIALRHQIMKLAAMLKQYIPGFEHAYVSWTPASIGVRLTRIVECEYDLSLEEIVSGKRFGDEVYLYGFHDCAPRITIQEGGYYGVPYRALLPKHVEGLLVAGRCITSTWEAHMSTRNTVSCMAQGQAAGTAAALCVKENILPRDLNAEKLRKTLRSQGVFLGDAT